MVGEERDTVTRRWGKRETVLDTTLSPGGGVRGRHCHQEEGEEGDIVTRRRGKRETIPNATLSPDDGGRGRPYITIYCHQEGGERGRLYLTLLCHHQNDPCVKMGSHESRFNVSLTVRGKVRRQ